MRRVQETTDRQIKAEASKLKPITNLFPEMENAQENIEELQNYGEYKNKRYPTTSYWKGNILHWKPLR